ncbi:DUF3139 domain-containing protein [Paenibacillus sp. A3]|uniref:DUF3139 domain-containing protein n=1 Tax=Paenibacillus sp. A3 TaxID=1337054 RepID=UPI0006D54A2D|nr:DUF3139 domain-containing protein [Paenibacillus sp. A3]
MARKILIWCVIVLVVLILSIYCYIQLKIKKLEQDLQKYLIEEKHYTHSDILSIEGRLSKMPKYPIAVIFRDEPNVIYIYTDRDVGEWIQISSRSLGPTQDIKFKHKEEIK